MSDNQGIQFVLKDFVASVPDGYEYFVLGSLALVSYTAPLGYERTIRDIDIICSRNGFESIRNFFIAQEYKFGTFVPKNSIFYKQLSRLSFNRYCRFEKCGQNIELHVSDFVHRGGLLTIELYPGFRVSFPDEVIVSTEFSGITFKTASPEFLYCIYNLSFRTWGRS